MWPEKLISVVAVDLLVKCKYSQISNTHTCTLTHHTHFNNVLYQFQIDLEAMCIRKKTPTTLDFFLPAANRTDASFRKNYLILACMKGKFYVVVMMVPSQCLWYITQVWLSSKVGYFIETLVWRGAIQYSVYTAGRLRNVLCSFSYTWNWNWLNAINDFWKLEFSFFFKFKI